MKHRLAVCVFLLQCCTFSAAQDTPGMSLREVFAAIDKDYPRLQSYELKMKAARSLAEGSQSWMPPTVSIALDRFPYKLDMLRQKEDPMNQAGIMVSVQQMMTNPYKLNTKKEYLASLENVQGNELEWQKNILHFTARIYYIRRYTAEQKRKLLKENRDLLQLLVKTAKDKYAYNQADLGTIFKAEGALSELMTMEKMLDAQIAESTIGLNTLMNRDIQTSFDIDTLMVPIDYARRQPVTTSAETERNDLLSMQNRIRAMKLNQRWMASGSRPDFGIQVSHGQMFGMPNQFSIMGMMTIPLVPWSSRMYKSEVRSMGFEIEAMEKERNAMQLMAEQMIREKITMLGYEKEQLDNYDRNVVPSYQRNLESALLAYRQNTGSFFVLLDAWNMLFMKKMERIDKLGQVLTVQAEYEYQREIK